MNTEITKQEPKSVILDEAMGGTWGSGGTSTEDMLIPRVLLMQAMSQIVSNGKAAPGDVIDSVDMQPLAKPGTAVEIIPIMTFLEWRVSKFIDGQWQFEKKVPWNQTNATWQYESIIDGIQTKNEKAINVFCLLPNKLDELPFLISFKSSSYQAGKKLSTHFQISSMKGKPPASVTFALTSVKQQKDKYSFFAFDVSKKRDTTKEELAIAYRWWKTLSATKVKVDEAEAVSEEAVPF